MMNSSAIESPGYEVLCPHGLHRADAGWLSSRAGRAGAVLYRLASEQARRYRVQSRPAPWRDTTVVSVGNLEVGGNGKTPLAIHLLDHLTAAGQRPAYVSRGFGGVAAKLDLVTFVSALEAGGARLLPRIRVLRRDSAALAHQIGDEGALVAWRCPSVPLFFSRHKQRAVAVARAIFEPSHVILDDAFQTWGMPRDRDIVLVDGRSPFGNGMLLPAGTLRERPCALQRADYVGINGCERDLDYDDLRARVRESAGREVPLFGIIRSLAVTTRHGGAIESVAGARVATVSGIARPQSFESMVVALGLDVRLALRFPDHHRYTAADVEGTERVLRNRGIDAVVATEKDWVKLRELGCGFDGLWVARLKLELRGADVRAMTQKPQAVPAADCD